MKYKEFVDWCNERACDGCWSYNTAVYCIAVVRRINSLPFWKRKKEWLKVKDSIERNVVSVINAKIHALKGGEGRPLETLHQPQTKLTPTKSPTVSATTKGGEG